MMGTCSQYPEKHPRSDWKACDYAKNNKLQSKWRKKEQVYKCGMCPLFSAKEELPNSHTGWFEGRHFLEIISED
jgi:hypothetical protein